jgi:predicted membrane GTPase involved in stress response
MEVLVNSEAFRKGHMKNAMEFSADDELIEIKPKEIGLRKRVLKANDRPKK